MRFQSEYEDSNNHGKESEFLNLYQDGSSSYKNEQSEPNSDLNMNRKDDKENVKQDQEEAKAEKEERHDKKISEYGQVTLDSNDKSHKIHLLSIIGEIEGHECLSQNAKTTKYEHVLPQLAAIEDSTDIDGVLILINTVGGDVESGLAIAEMISSLTKPTVSLVLGGGHSIGVPLAVSTNYSFIVPSGTMIIHPVRMSGTVIGAQQTFDYFKLIQDRIIGFIASHCKTSEERLELMMMNTGILTKDLGTILVGKKAVEEGLIDEVGGIREAMLKLHELIDQGMSKENSNQESEGNTTLEAEQKTIEKLSKKTTQESMTSNAEHKAVPPKGATKKGTKKTKIE